MRKEVKRTLIFGMVLIAIAVCLAAFAVVYSFKGKVDKAAQQVQSLRFSKEYPEVSKENSFQYITIEDTLEIINRGTGIIYFGFQECPWCQVYVPILDEVIREKNVDKVYYYNPKDIRENNTKEYQRIITLLGKYMNDDKEGNKRLYVPHIFAIRDGKVLGEIKTTPEMAQSKANEYFTDSRKQQLKSEIASVILKFNESCNDSGSKGC